jgi:hypothetical protein
MEMDVEKVMNKKFRVGCAGLLLLPLFAHAASTVNLPITLPTATSGSAAKASTVTPALGNTSSSVTSLPLLPSSTSTTPAASSGQGGIPLPGLEGLGGTSPIGKPTGIRPIRLPGPNLFTPSGR